MRFNPFELQAEPRAIALYAPMHQSYGGTVPSYRFGYAKWLSKARVTCKNSLLPIYRRAVAAAKSTAARRPTLPEGLACIGISATDRESQDDTEPESATYCHTTIN
jgi:hypothetical protein